MVDISALKGNSWKRVTGNGNFELSSSKGCIGTGSCIGVMQSNPNKRFVSFDMAEERLFKAVPLPEIDPPLTL